MTGDKNVKLDIKAAKQAVEDFFLSTGLRCLLLDSEGNHLYWSGNENVCSELSKAIGHTFNCSVMLGRSVTDALRFGGKYVYSCPMGFAFFASPIMEGGILAGALVAGPVQIMNTEEQLKYAEFDVYEAGPDVVCAAREAISHAPKKSLEEVKALSRLLFANAVYISDSANMLLDASRESEMQNAVSNYIEYLKYSDGDRVPYPIDKEQELFKTVVRGDQEMANVLVNQILGHIYFYAVDNEEIYIRIQELLIVIMRAVASGGADVAHILELSRRYMRELRMLRNQEQLTSWLATNLHTLMNQISEASDSRHCASVTKAIGYMKQKYALNPSLEEVAEYAGYSPSYFSRIFKEDTGMTFSEFLNDFRVEKSKSLLLTTSLTIADISSMMGYNDQSYFCRIFKNITGTTPDRYRKRTRRIEYE